MRGLAVVAMVEVSAGRMDVDEAGRHVGETCASAFAPQSSPSAGG